MTVFDFMGNHPVLTIILALIIGETLAEISEISEIFKNK